MDRLPTMNEAKVGLILMTSNGYILKHALNLRFRASNNKTKYDALLSGLKVATKFQVKKLSIHCDSMLIVNQVMGDYAAHNPTIGLYLTKSKALLEEFEKCEIQEILRNKNGHTATLTNITSIVDYLLEWTIPFEYLAAPSIHELELDIVVTIGTREN